MKSFVRRLKVLSQQVSVSKTYLRGLKNRKENPLVSYTAWSPRRLKPPRARGLTLIKLKKNYVTIRFNNGIYNMASKFV